MSYNILNRSIYLDAGLDVFKAAVAQSIAVSSPVKFTSHDTAKSHNTFVNQTGELEAFTTGTNEYRIVVPNDSHTYYMYAALDFSNQSGTITSNDYYRFSFYDVTASQNLGFAGTRILSYNQLIGQAGGVVSDELAKVVVQGPKTIEIRITEMPGILPTKVDVSANASSYPTIVSSSRLFIWKL